VISCLTSRTRLGSASGAASAVTRMVTGCLTCLTHFRILQLRGFHTALRPVSINIFFITRRIGEASEASGWKCRGYVVSGCLGSSGFSEAREADAEASIAATANFLLEQL